MAQYLFVYGTLMRGFDNRYAQLLHTNANFIGEGRLKGRLYDLGPYPVAVYDAHDNTEIIGEVYELTSDAILAQLDEYEEYGPQFPQPNEYVRINVPVKSGTKIIDCFFYQYNRSTDGLRQIMSGSYLNR